MNKRNFLILFILPIMLNTISLADTSTEVTLSENTCLHKAAANSQVIAIIPANTKLTLTETKNSWKKTTYNNIEGWIYQKAAAAKTPIVQSTKKESKSWSLAGKSFNSSGTVGNYASQPRSNLIFKNGSKIHPVFADRLNDLAIHLGGKITISYGFRSVQDQISIIKSMYNPSKHTIGSGGKLVNKSGQTVAAKPGSSNHQKGLAVDITNAGVGRTIREKMTNAQLKEFGLWKPMSYEPWHIQPIL